MRVRGENSHHFERLLHASVISLINGFLLVTFMWLNVIYLANLGEANFLSVFSSVVRSVTLTYNLIRLIAFQRSEQSSKQVTSQTNKVGSLALLNGLVVVLYMLGVELTLVDNGLFRLSTLMFLATTNFVVWVWFARSILKFRRLREAGDLEIRKVLENIVLLSKINGVLITLFMWVVVFVADHNTPILILALARTITLVFTLIHFRKNGVKK